ncbi:anthranilate phosphoribosyltransferase [Sphingosinicella soli]|uniref:Anthranilate phosphoribosyltransferase n=1 Tax=Sphingosinicella soli TaxID=333708 RepID=A0A7W7F4J8_9SPHN|nr:anthranilate phosphoribosyltransferase [Sphingosinicella soli]
MKHLPGTDAPLGEEEARGAFDAILNADIEDAEIARFLTGLAERGETVDEIVAAASVLRSRMRPVAAPGGAIDVCGTGGDGAHTLNISTAVAIVIAACGVTVAKHGNRAASSKSGAADVLSALGLDLDLASDTVERSLAEIGIGFLFAAKHHPVMARVAGVRRAIGRRTIFNMIGPLANPAGVTRQLVGVPGRQWVLPIAEALQKLGADAAMVVHGSDGLDELTVTGGTTYTRLSGGRIETGEVTPETAGLSRHAPDAIRGGTPEENAAAMLRLLGGEQGGYRDIVCLNAAGAMIVAGKAHDWATGAALAASALDDGRARALLERWKAFR